MDFFEKVGGTISARGKVAAQKAKDVADLAKMNAQLNQLEGKIKTYYQIIGEKVYLNEKDQDHSGLEAEFDLITDAYAEIGRLKKQIADLKGTKECPGCHEEIDSAFAFCPKCGAKMEEPAEEAGTCGEEACGCETAEEAGACGEEACGCETAEEAGACGEEACGCEAAEEADA